VKTGSEAWKTPIENYPEDKGTRLDVTIMGDAVLLSGPEVAAFSASDGKLLWRMPFPGTFGPKAAAIPLGDDLYFSDGSTITRSDPASGKEMWRAPISDGAFQALTTNERGVFILLKGSGEKPTDSIAALDRNNGKQLWKSDLTDRAASPMNILGDRLYVTTPGSVIAMKTSDGSVAYSTTIPSGLQSGRQLPDNLRIVSDRIIVAREDGVMALQKTDGKLLFADQVPGGIGFTYDYSTNRFRHATSNAVRRSKKHPFPPNPDSANPDVNYQVAMSQQRVAYAASRALSQNYTNMTNIMLYNTSQPTFQQRQAQAGGAAFAVASLQMGVGMASALSGVWLARRAESYQARIQRAFETHAASLQGKYYVRPSYEQHRGWSLHAVNLDTGERANILLSSDDDERPNLLAAHLPAFSTDGPRIVSKGLGPNPELLKMHRGLLVHLGLLVQELGAYPSVLAFDLASLPFTGDSNIQIPATNPVDPEKRKLNDQLLAAAYQNDVEAARKALDAGANINAVSEYGVTPLMLSAEASVGSKNDGVVKLLLGRGADADMRDPSGLTALEHTNLFAAVFTKGMLQAEKDIKKAQKEHK